jgi:hypothetical protein
MQLASGCPIRLSPSPTPAPAPTAFVSGKHIYQPNSYQEEHITKTFFFFFLGTQVLLVVGGLNASGSLSDVEVVSLDPETNPVPPCLAELKSFPTTVYWGAGGVLGSGKSII